MQFTMSSPSYKNTNEMPIKQTTMKIDITKVKKSSKVSSKVSSNSSSKVSSSPSRNPYAKESHSSGYPSWHTDEDEYY